MITANELRIGNYVVDHGSVEQIQFGSDIDDIMHKEPIPLTEEWLNKLGFEKEGKEYHHTNTMLFQLFNVTALDGGLKIIAGRMQDNVILQISEPITSVHQLQNITHALTGQELTIKTKEHGINL